MIDLTKCKTARECRDAFHAKSMERIRHEEDLRACFMATIVFLTIIVIVVGNLL